jgi:D-alanyl-D-alanine carboxypeptidase (penicillin-binding protein 5/6)
MALRYWSPAHVRHMEYSGSNVNCFTYHYNIILGSLDMKIKRFFSFILFIILLCGLVPAASALDDPKPACTAAILVDVTNGNDKVLYEYNADETRYPASITKVMTALLTIEAVERGDLSLDQEVSGTTSINDDLSLDGSSENVLAVETMSVKNLLYCMLMASANETCNILAENVSGNIPSFVDAMNKRAEELGMTGTHFANCHGLQNEDHYTTARDIYLLLKEAMTHDLFRQIVHTAKYTVPATNKSGERTLINTDALISNLKYKGYYYENALGGKTGSTPEAGKCLASSAQKDGRTLICIVLGAEEVTQSNGSVQIQSFSESKRLFEWGFQNFSMQTLVKDGDLVQEIPVSDAKSTNYVVGKAQGDLTALLPTDYDANKLQKTITLTSSSVEAPVSAGQVLGQVSVSYDGTDYGTVSVVAADSVSRSQLLYVLHCITSFFGQLWVKLIGLVLLVAVLVLLVKRFSLGKRQNRKARSGGFSSGNHGYRGRRRK